MAYDDQVGANFPCGCVDLIDRITIAQSALGFDTALTETLDAFFQITADFPLLFVHKIGRIYAACDGHCCGRRDDGKQMDLRFAELGELGALTQCGTIFQAPVICE
jgi:hypothetical protein